MGKVYVGNLPFRATEEEVISHFSTVGNVISVNIIKDRDTGKPRGFCFVEMENSDQAISELNGKDFQGRNLKISPAIDKKESRGEEHHRGGGFRQRDSHHYATARNF